MRALFPKAPPYRCFPILWEALRAKLSPFHGKRKPASWAMMITGKRRSGTAARVQETVQGGTHEDHGSQNVHQRRHRRSGRNRPAGNGGVRPIRHCEREIGRHRKRRASRRPQGERLRFQHRRARADRRVRRRGNLRHRRSRRGLRRRARRTYRRGRGRKGSLSPERGRGVRQWQRLLLRRERALHPRRHQALAQRLGPPQRLEDQQRLVRLLCGIRRGSRAVGDIPGPLRRHRAHRVPHRQLHPLR